MTGEGMRVGGDTGEGVRMSGDTGRCESEW